LRCARQYELFLNLNHGISLSHCIFRLFSCLSISLWHDALKHFNADGQALIETAQFDTSLHLDLSRFSSGLRPIQNTE